MALDFRVNITTRLCFSSLKICLSFIGATLTSKFLTVEVKGLSRDEAEELHFWKIVKHPPRPDIKYKERSFVTHGGNKLSTQ
jgi:hypothetical protein